MHFLKNKIFWKLKKIISSIILINFSIWIFQIFFQNKKSLIKKSKNIYIYTNLGIRETSQDIFRLSRTNFRASRQKKTGRKLMSNSDFYLLQISGKFNREKFIMFFR